MTHFTTSGIAGQRQTTETGNNTSRHRVMQDSQNGDDRMKMKTRTNAFLKMEN